MHDARGKILIVDGDVSIRTSLSLIFTELGYRVRSCKDGLSAESEIQKEIPDVLLSDLNLAPMSGLEFLTVVRRWFPSIRVIAMGGAFSGNRVPPGVPADAFYRKGGGPDRLIEAVDALTQPKRSDCRLSMENLFGFQVFEAIPSSPGAERSTYPAPRRIVFLVAKKETPGERFPTRAETQTQEVHSL
jgi:CheY-like chemotaxis protein